MRQSLTRLIQSVVSTIWPLATDIWDAWGIQLLVLASFICQIILILLGGRRRYSYNAKIGFLIWASYLLASNIATIALGKLTVTTIRNPTNPEYDVELQGLLAPLLLMHLGNPDSISAYSVEDTRMGKRHALNLLVQVGLVVWILIRCFDTSSPISMLYIPLFIAGIIEPMATILALTSVYDDTTSVYELNKIEPIIREEKKRLDGAPNFLNHVLMAYHRFDCLRPHRVNWIYHSTFVDNWMSVDELKPKEAFDITEIELGFVYDVIYTQSPIICTTIGLVSRAISIICLVSALCGFSAIFRSAFLLDCYVAYTYAILIGSTFMELYQVVTLPFSYTVVIALQNWVKSERILEFLVRHCKNQKIWSNSLTQLNLMDYCFIKDIDIPKQVSFILKKLHQELEEKIKKYRRSTRATFYEKVDLFLKERIVETMRELEEKRRAKNLAFEDRGFWTLVDDFQNQTTTSKNNNNNNDAIINTAIVKSCKDKELDKCIIIWHIATDLLLSSLDPLSYNSPNPNTQWERVSKLLSNYMMYLLMDHPYMLSLTTSDITLGYASSAVKALTDQIPPSFDKQLRIAILQAMMNEEVRIHVSENCKTFITRDWNVLGDVKQLVIELKKLEDDGDKWELIGTVWIKLLYYAASKSHAYQHMKMLRKGGELISHVWLLILHKTDKLATSYFQPSRPTHV